MKVFVGRLYLQITGNLNGCVSSEYVVLVEKFKMKFKKWKS